MKKISVLIVILVIVATKTTAFDGERIVNLRGTWKFAIGDNSDWAKVQYDDDDWERIYVPSEWEDEGFRGYNGYAWYRKSFDFDESMDDGSLYLVLGEIDDVDEVFVNGILIGSTGSFFPNYQTAYNIDRRYHIPFGIVKPGKENIIAVRVFDEGGPGGILGRRIGIYTNDLPLDEDMTLYGSWRFKVGDEPEWKETNIDDSDWDQIQVPGIWENQGYWNYNGFAWYRKKVIIPETLRTEQLVLIMGRIDDLDEVYVNGELVGSTGRIGKYGGRIHGHEWQEFRGYYVPSGLLKRDQENVIAVRVYDGMGEGGIHEGPVGLVTEDHYRDFWKKKYRNSWWSYFDSW